MSEIVKVWTRPKLATKGRSLSLLNNIFSWRDLRYSHLNNAQKSSKTFHSEQELLLWIGRDFHHLVKAVELVSSNSNHVDLHPTLFQGFCLGNGLVWLNIWLAIGDQEHHLLCVNTTTFGESFNIRSDYNFLHLLPYLYDFIHVSEIWMKTWKKFPSPPPPYILMGKEERATRWWLFQFTSFSLSFFRPLTLFSSDFHPLCQCS